HQYLVLRILQEEAQNRLILASAHAQPDILLGFDKMLLLGDPPLFETTVEGLFQQVFTNRMKVKASMLEGGRVFFEPT
ncbi:MAG: hypothetical protein CUN55_17985, partial [Phototrophicales bacterium]